MNKKIPLALLEEWYRSFYFGASIDISGSGVYEYSLAEVRKLANISIDELDSLVFRDSHSYGHPELRAVIAKRWTKNNPDQVLVTHGSTEALFLVFKTLLNPKDEVVTVYPCYHAYNNVLSMLGCKLRHWKLKFSSGFTPDLTDLETLVSPKTRMIILNFPNNPTGSTITENQLQEIIRIARKSDSYLLWDAALADLNYTTENSDPFLHYEKAISIGTFSKAYGLPGLRLGWCLADQDILTKCVHYRDYVTLLLSPLIEYMATRIITHSENFLLPRLEEVKKNLKILNEWATEHWEYIDYVAPKGGVTAFMKLKSIDNTQEFCKDLMNQHKVLIIPGECFWEPGFVRISIGSKMEKLVQGLEILSSSLKKFHSNPSIQFSS